jgi:hypothetical protein
LDEVVEAIVLPEYKQSSTTIQPLNCIELSDVVVTQLREFIVAIAKGYHKNQFHNFDHACHVTIVKI